MLKLIEKKVSKQPFDMPLDQLHDYIDRLFDKITNHGNGRKHETTKNAYAHRASV